MEAIIKTMTDNLNMLKKQHSDNYTKLKKDDRDDEAIIEKIKTNIADIFLKMLNVSLRQANGASLSDQQKIAKLKEVYKGFFTKIPSNWKQSLKEAKENNDYELILIEKEKIKMAEKIEKMFNKLTEDKNV